MNPEDVIWRIIDRLQESKEIFAASLEGLHPERDKELIDAISEAVYAAMERAARFGNYSYKAIKRILLQQERNPGALPEPPAAPLPLTVDVPAVDVQQRSLDYYAQAGRS